jgi:hypothetical protein
MEIQFHYRTSYSEKRNIPPLRRVVSHLFCCKDRNLGLPLGQMKHISMLWLKQQRGLKKCKVTAATDFVFPYKLIFSITSIVIAMQKGFAGGLVSSASENEVTN